jgi:L-fucose isomerase-like protein
MEVRDLKGAERRDLFMGFHCGNTASACLCEGYEMRHQLIMHRLMEPGREPDITCGTLEGKLKAGAATVFRLQARADNHVQSYVAEGEILDVDPRSFGGIGVFAIPGFARFYRHVLIEKQYPHHTAVAFARAGRVLWDAVRMLGVGDVDAPRPAGAPYPGENPFAV